VASTLKDERNAVRARLNDLNFGNAILQSDLVDPVIEDVYKMMLGEGLGARAWQTGIVQVDEGIIEYAIPTPGTALEQQDIIALRWNGEATNGAAGTELWKIDPVTIMQMLRDNQNTNRRQTPTHWAIQESSSNQTLLLFPAPRAEDEGNTLDIFGGPMATALVLDTALVSLSQNGLSALRDLSAARIAGKLGPKMIEKLDLPLGIQQTLEKTGERMLYDEKARRARQWQPMANKRPGWPRVA
jgi:hypothetical protein